ncbi:MAG: hypothetical protein GY852_11115 [bacterium]|nr:hypothetical protein [bacterium]
MPGPVTKEKGKSKGRSKPAAFALEEKSEPNVANLEELTKAIDFLEGNLKPPTVEEQMDDPIQAYLEGGDPTLFKQFLMGKQMMVQIDFSVPGTDREGFESALNELAKEGKDKKKTFLGFRYLNMDIVEITNPYYVPSAFTEKGGKLGKQLKGTLEQIRDSGSPSAIMEANACIFQLRQRLLARDDIIARASSVPPWLEKPMAAVADAHLAIANHFVKRLEYIQKNAGGKRKVAFPASFDKQKKRLKRSLGKAEKQLLDETLGKSAMSRIESGIQRGLYSELEIAVYKQVKTEFLSLLAKFKGISTEEKGLGALSALDPKTIDAISAYVTYLETIAWKVDYSSAKFTLGRILETKASTESPIQRQGMFRYPITIPPGYKNEEEVKAHTSHMSRGGHRRPGVTQYRHLYKMPMIEQKILLFDGEESAREKLILASKKAPAYFALLKTFVEEYIEGPQFHMTSEDTESYVATFERLEKNSEKLLKEAKKLQTARQFGKGVDERSVGQERVHIKEYTNTLLEFCEAYEQFSETTNEECNSLLNLISTRERELALIDENLPVSSRVAAAFDLLILNHALEITFGSAAIGGAAGLIATRSPTGAAAGTKLGWTVGGMIVAAAGMFNTGDALVSYIKATNPRDEERAIANMRRSSFYMGFALGGGATMLRLFGSTAGTAIYRTTFAGMVGANSVLLYHDAAKRAAEGDTSAYMDIPVDIAFIALGATGYVRTFSGAWKAVKLPAYMRAEISGKALIAGSFGIAEQQLLPKVVSQSLKWGYSPRGVFFNTAFSLPFVYTDMKKAAEKGKYQQAFRLFSDEFSRMSRQMVAFEFLILSPIKAGYASVVRRFPLKTAARVRFLQAQGLHRRISEIAAKRGAKLNSPEMQKNLIEIAFGSKGKFTSSQIQILLGLEGEAGAAAAKQIAKEVTQAWKIAVECYPTKGVAAKKVLERNWEKVSKYIEEEQTALAKSIRVIRTPTAVGGRYAVPVLIGAHLYTEHKNVRKKKLDVRLAKRLTPTESSFMKLLVGKDPQSLALRKTYGIPEIEHSQILDAFDEIDSKKYNSNKKLDAAEKKLRIACSWSLLMSGNPEPTIEEIDQLAAEMEYALRDIHLELDETAPTAALAQMGYLLRTKGSEYFLANYHKNEGRIMESGLLGEEAADMFVHNTAGIYAAATMKKSMAWGASVSRDFLAALDEEKISPEQSTLVRGAPLLSGIVRTGEGTPALDTVAYIIAVNHPLAVLMTDALEGELGEQ